MRELGFKRVLFLVHRNQIAKQAKVSFERVFGSRIKAGLVSGSKHDCLIAISKSGRSIASEDVQNFLHATERGIQVHLFVRKNKDDKISKEFYYLGHMQASGNVREFVMPNTDKTAVEIEWMLDVPVREDLYEYIVNE